MLETVGRVTLVRPVAVLAAVMWVVIKAGVRAAAAVLAAAARVEVTVAVKVTVVARRAATDATEQPVL